MAAIKSRINLRNDSTANWLANSSVVLLKGEVGIEFLESGRTKIKIGNGVTPWIDLPYFNGGGDISAINNDVFIVDGNGNLTMLGFEEAEIGSSPIKSNNGKIIWVKNEVKALETKVESLTEIVNNKVDLVFSEVNGEQVPWTLLSPENKLKLETIEVGAQENKIEAICLANSGKCLAIVNKTVQLPFATGSMPGLVKLSKEVVLDENQALSIREVNVNKLVQTAGEEIHLYCGDASL